MTSDGEETRAEVGRKSLFFLRALTLATVVIVLFFIIDAIIA